VSSTIFQILASIYREFSSSGFHLLSVPSVKTHAGTRAFSEHVKSSNSIVYFRHQLKIHLSDLIILLRFPLHLIICWRTLHCTWAMSSPIPCSGSASELYSFRGYLHNRGFVIIVVVIIIIIINIIIIMGDCNMDCLGFSSRGFIPVIYKPTWVITWYDISIGHI